MDLRVWDEEDALREGGMVPGRRQEAQLREAAREREKLEYGEWLVRKHEREKASCSEVPGIDVTEEEWDRRELERAGVPSQWGKVRIVGTSGRIGEDVSFGAEGGVSSLSSSWCVGWARAAAMIRRVVLLNNAVIGVLREGYLSDWQSTYSIWFPVQNADDPVRRSAEMIAKWFPF
jgi:hypothetical protein